MATNRQHLTGQPALAAVDKMRRALELRREGKNYDAIAAAVGYTNRGTAHAAVMKALRRTLQEPADAVRRLECERLDALWAGVWAKARTGDLQAIDGALKIMVRRAKLLGLDAPAQSDVTTGGRAIAPRIVKILAPPGVGFVPEETGPI